MPFFSLLLQPKVFLSHFIHMVLTGPDIVRKGVLPLEGASGLALEPDGLEFKSQLCDPGTPCYLARSRRPHL